MTLYSKSKLLNGPMIALNVCITGSVSVPHLLFLFTLIGLNFLSVE